MMMLRWQCMWFELNRKIQAAAHAGPELKIDPTFVLGLWRSGTTYMHELLSTCPGMQWPTTWQCMNPSSFLLRQAPESPAEVVRPMDGMVIANDTPQEDEFALLALGVPSAYLGFLDPRRLPELEKWLDEASWSRSSPAGWSETWLEFLRGVMGNRSGSIALKSPGHTFRVRALADIFPSAKYVWMVRDPVETFLSNRKMWTAMFKRYAFWEPNPAFLDNFLNASLKKGALALLNAAGRMPRSELVVVTFEQLTSQPTKTLSGITERLGLNPPSHDNKSFLNLVARRDTHTVGRYDVREIPAGLRMTVEDLSRAQTAAAASHGI